MAVIDESALIKQAKKGNEKAFETIVHLYEGRIYSYTYRLLENREDAQEITQETFIKLWGALADFREEASLSTYLFRIAKNASLDRLRKKKEPTLSLREPSPEEEPYFLSVPDPEPEHNPAEAFLKQERIRILRRAVSQLPRDAREILILREFQNLSYTEIGKILEVEDGTVRSRLSRARMKLKKILEEWNFSV